MVVAVLVGATWVVVVTAASVVLVVTVVALITGVAKEQDAQLESGYSFA